MSTGTEKRGLTVEILLTPGGRLVTTRIAFARRLPGEEHINTDSATSAVYETPAGAYRWLLDVRRPRSTTPCRRLSS